MKTDKVTLCLWLNTVVVLVAPLLESFGFLAYQELVVYPWILERPRIDWAAALTVVYTATIPSLVFLWFHICMNRRDSRFLVLRRIKVAPADEKIEQMAADLSSCMGLKKPKMLVSPQIGSAFSFGLEPENATIVLSEGVLKLNLEETKAIIAHELAHVKDDTQRLYTYIVGHQFMLIYSLSGLIAICEWNFFQMMWGIYSMGQLLLNVFLLTHICSSILIAYTFFVILYSATVSPFFLRMDYREYDADTYCSFVTGNPYALVRAIWNLKSFVEEPRKREPWFITRINFVNPSEKYSEDEMNDWERILRLRFFYRMHPPDTYRSALLALQYLSIYGHIKFRPKSDILSSLLWRLKTYHYYDSIWGYQFCALQQRFMKIKSSERQKVINYVVQKGDMFNVYECKTATNVSAHDVFTVFVVLAATGAVEIVEPKLLPEYLVLKAFAEKS